MEHWIAFWTAVWVGSSRVTRWVVDWLCNAKPAKASAVGEAGETGEQPETNPGEQPTTPKKTTPWPAPAEGSALLRWCMLALAAVVAKALPYTTAITLTLAAAWGIAALILGYAAALPKKEPAAAADEQSVAPDPAETLTRDDIAPLLHGLLKPKGGVHLRTLAQALPERPRAARWETRDVRALLTHVGVRVRAGVRVPGEGGREGVHRDDVPALPSPTSEATHVAVVVAGQDSNNNDDNMTVTHSATGAQVTITPASTHAHQV